MSALKRIFLDTNILIYLRLQESPLHTEALSTVRKLEADGYELWISRQVLREYYAALRLPNVYQQPVSLSAILDDIRMFEKGFHVANDTAETTHHWVNLVQSLAIEGKATHDANVVATMLAHGIAYLLTYHVDDFKQFDAYIELIPLLAKDTV